MFREFQKYNVDYIVLLLGLCLFGFAFFAVWPNKQNQQLASIGIGVFYLIWGLVHHQRKDHVTARVVLEYFFVSVFGVSMLLLLLK